MYTIFPPFNLLKQIPVFASLLKHNVCDHNIVLLGILVTPRAFPHVAIADVYDC
jgi:hypothetical protein